jgi:hypothetical protein
MTPTEAVEQLVQLREAALKQWSRCGAGSSDRAFADTYEGGHGKLDKVLQAFDVAIEALSAE